MSTLELLLLGWLIFCGIMANIIGCLILFERVLDYMEDRKRLHDGKLPIDLNSIDSVRRRIK